LTGDRLDVDAGLAPQPLLLLVGAAVVAARSERRFHRGDRLEGEEDIAPAGYLGGIADRADEHEIVVHDLSAVDAVAGGDEGKLGGSVVDELDIGTPRSTDLERLPRADGDDPHLDTGLPGEGGQQVLEQTRLLGRRRQATVMKGSSSAIDEAQNAGPARTATMTRQLSISPHPLSSRVKIGFRQPGDALQCVAPAAGGPHSSSSR
jgi:hypothetical protein